jgi:XTP/dITP diphosphohydrolase/tetrapyrrole methylase family protein/MazG family protein
VFGDHDKLDTAGEVITKWEQIKATEKKNGPAQQGVFKELPPRLPALMFAEAVMKQIEKKALPAAPAVDPGAVAGTAAGLTEAAAGRRLFELAAACRQAGIDPEMALRKECDRVMRDVESRVQSRA